MPLRFAGPWRDFEKARTDSIARADSIAALTDSTVKQRLAGRGDRRRPRRDARAAARGHRAQGAACRCPPARIPNSDYVLITTQPLATGTCYRLEAHGVRNLLGDTAIVGALLQVPKPPPPPPPKAGAPPTAPATPATRRGKPRRRPEATRPMTRDADPRRGAAERERAPRERRECRRCSPTAPRALVADAVRDAVERARARTGAGAARRRGLGTRRSRDVARASARGPRSGR